MFYFNIVSFAKKNNINSEVKKSANFFILFID